MRTDSRPTSRRKLWRPSSTGIPASTVLRFGRKENFWEMGDTGPCGPCTEIHYDLGPAADAIPDPDDARSGVNGDNCRVIEIWNLVFIQYNRGADGKLSPLPKKHVDTGMGFRRLAAVVQGKTSNYDTDLFSPIFRAIERKQGGPTGRRRVPPTSRSASSRTTSDAVRGLLPTACCRATRARLRPAAHPAAGLQRFGRQALEMKEPFIHRLVDAVVSVLGRRFPSRPAPRSSRAAHRVGGESPSRRPSTGLDLYAQLADRVRGEGRDHIDGGEAYDLYATFGFPRDLVELMAREDGLRVESSGWDAAQAAHREASKSAGAFGRGFDAEALEGLPATERCYYRAGAAGEGDGLRATARLVKAVDDTHLVLDRSPFYSESGGQVSDRGVITGEGFRFRVDDVRLVGDIVLHVGEVEEGSLASAPASLTAAVDAARRAAVMRNHTGTHLLHWALKRVLGEHATQQGSLVAEDRLRFDVAHPKAISLEEIEEIERLVNERVVENAALGTTLEDLEAARARGVTALFGEKYADRVRVVDIGGFSTELCGGTHCAATGDIGAFVIASEGAVQAGVRRIEALTGPAAIRVMQDERRLLRETAAAVKAKVEEIPARVEALQKQVKELKKAGGRQAGADAGSLAKELLGKASSAGDAKVVVARIEGDAKALSDVADILRNNHGAVAGLLAAAQDDKVLVVAFASADLAGKRVHAGQIAKLAAGILGGGGGGRPDFAQAGGKDATKIEEALASSRAAIEAALAS
ncbi:MAG: alanine--tRNA ligase-related protein [Planctomycetota bacterium]